MTGDRLAQLREAGSRASGRLRIDAAVKGASNPQEQAQPACEACGAAGEGLLCISCGIAYTPAPRASLFDEWTIKAIVSATITSLRKSPKHRPNMNKATARERERIAQLIRERLEVEADQGEDFEVEAIEAA